jgi:hypothetical protein
LVRASFEKYFICFKTNCFTLRNKKATQLPKWQWVAGRSWICQLISTKIGHIIHTFKQIINVKANIAIKRRANGSIFLKKILFPKWEFICV